METLLVGNDNQRRTELTIRSYAEECERWRTAVKHSAVATLYHDPRWIGVLRDSYGLSISVVRAAAGSGDDAVCLVARPRASLSKRAVALPFSDLCPPLAPDAAAAQALMRGLAQSLYPAALEVRGIAGPPPWRVVSTFALWTLDLNRPLARLRRQFAINFQRNLKKAGRNEVRLESGDGSALIGRFCALHFRARHRQGLPAQPSAFFRMLGERFRPAGGIEVWIAARGGEDLAAVLLLRSGPRLYYKWAARAAGENVGAGHLLVWHIIERFANECESLDLGRADIRNHGLSRFKAELGAVAEPLPYSFAPTAPGDISSERLSGANLLLSKAWKRLPASMARTLGGAIYGILS